MRANQVVEPFDRRSNQLQVTSHGSGRGRILLNRVPVEEKAGLFWLEWFWSGSANKTEEDQGPTGAMAKFPFELNFGESDGVEAIHLV